MKMIFFPRLMIVQRNPLERRIGIQGVLRKYKQIKEKEVKMEMNLAS